MADGAYANNYIKVNFAALEAMVADLQSGVGKIDSMLGDLDGQAKNLMGTWDGTARAEYQRHQAEWTASATGLKEVLNGVRGAVEQARLDMLDTESRNTNLFT